MSAWNLLKQDDITVSMRDGSEMVTAAWLPVGTHESDYGYTLGYDAAQKIGERFGAGQYLCLSDELQGKYFVRITIGERAEFYEITDEEAPEPDHLEGNIGANIAGGYVPEGIPEGSNLEAVLDPRD